jgi:hypothetical protein
MIEIFAVFDSKADAFAQPFFSETTETAVRAFATECRNPASGLHQHAEDYTLFHIGSYDQANGQLNAMLAPIHLAHALQFANGEPLPEASDGNNA